MAKTIARRVRVHGNVQGVFFRDSTRNQAEGLGVSGWVRNCADGTVEGHFEGPTDKVSELIEFCRSGPSRANVTDLEVDDAKPEGMSGFRVR